MRVIYGLNRFRARPRKPIVTFGSFDGIHLAHREILKRLVQRARGEKGTSLLITFEPHPLKVLRPQRPPSLLTCLPHRLDLLSKTGLEACWVLRFTPSFAKLSAEDFVKKILVDRLKVSEVWVGFDVAFGRDRRGSLSLLRRLGRRHRFGLFQFRKFSLGKKAVSSSRIRRFVEEGRFPEAARFLGRSFSIHGKVMHGRGVGFRLGAPTANLRLCEQMLPPLGVYAVWVRLEGRGVWGLLNLGTRPTFSPRRKRVVAEVHLLDFRGNLYGKKLEVIFLRKIRNERVFPTPGTLGLQIRKDEETLRDWIARRRVAPPPS